MLKCFAETTLKVNEDIVIKKSQEEDKLKKEIIKKLILELGNLIIIQRQLDKLLLYRSRDYGLEMALPIYEQIIDKKEYDDPSKEELDMLKKIFPHPNKNNNILDIPSDSNIFFNDKTYNNLYNEYDTHKIIKLNNEKGILNPNTFVSSNLTNLSADVKIIGEKNNIIKERIRNQFDCNNILDENKSNSTNQFALLSQKKVKTELMSYPRYSSLKELIVAKKIKYEKIV